MYEVVFPFLSGPEALCWPQKGRECVPGEVVCVLGG